MDESTLQVMSKIALPSVIYSAPPARAFPLSALISLSADTSD